MNNKSVKKKIVLIGVGLGCIAAIIVTVHLVLNGNKNTKDLEKTAVAAADGSTDANTLEKDLPYINDVNYTEAYEYPDVYKYPFQKSEDYVSNKELCKEFSQGSITSLTQKVRDYFKTAYNTGYRDISSDTASYVTAMSKFYNPDTKIFSDSYPVEGSEYWEPNEYIEELANTIVEKRLELDGEFVTNNSLVYQDGYTWVRGVLVYTDYSGLGLGKKKTVMLDVAMVPAADDNTLNSYCIKGIYKTNEFNIEE